MRIEGQNTDSAILGELGTRLARVRLERNATQEDIANAAGVSKRTIERLEAGRSVQLSNLVRVLRALDLSSNLDQLIPRMGPSPIEQLSFQEKERRRASTRRKPTSASGSWTWAEDS